MGTESGGMDQAISIMGEKGLAKLVHFKPVSPFARQALNSPVISSTTKATHIQAV